MNRQHLKGKLLVASSAVLYGLALNFVQFYLAWVCLVPFFIVIQRNINRKQAFYSGALFGFTLFCTIFYWLPQAIAVISKGSIAAILSTALVVPIVFASYYGCITLLFTILKAKKRAFWSDSLLIAGIWTTGGYLLTVIFPGMPWFTYDIGNTLLDNLYAIQPAVFGGIYLLNFFVVFINYLFAYFIEKRQWKIMPAPVGLIIIYMVIGYGILSGYKKQLAPVHKPVSVALLSGNIPEDMKWNEETGNTLAKGLLDLNSIALENNPDIVLWPEGIVPWPYSPNDDLLKAILSNTTPHPDVCHILGFKTVENNNVYNSAYCVQPDGRITGRHDKHFLVALAERPVNFFSSVVLEENKERDYFKPGKDNGVVNTSHCKAGVLICSELFIPEATHNCVKNGAEILVSLSDDALFASALGIVKYQFFKNRLRAVEARKDIAISCNMGISGMVASTGEIIAANHDTDNGYTQSVKLNPNNFKTISYNFSIFVLCISALIVLVLSFLNR